VRRRCTLLLGQDVSGESAEVSRSGARPKPAAHAFANSAQARAGTEPVRDAAARNDTLLCGLCAAHAHRRARRRVGRVHLELRKGAAGPRACAARRNIRDPACLERSERVRTQGDFHHWVALFNHFDALFDELLKPRADLRLQYDAPEAEADAPFPSSTVVAVLRVTAAILENCSNKHLYQSYDVRPSLRLPAASTLHGPR